MQFIVITGPTYLQAIRRIAKALTMGDGIELRIDYFKEITQAQLIEIIQMCKDKEKKIIFTVRSKKGGGKSDLHSVDLEESILRLAGLQPDYMDIEHTLSIELFSKVKETGVKIIASHHNFYHTPSNLSKILEVMLEKEAYCYKICTMARSLNDAFSMIRCIQKQKAKDYKFIGLCMGEFGVTTRQDGLTAGNYLNYKIMHIQDKVSEGINFA